MLRSLPLLAAASAFLLAAAPERSGSNAPSLTVRNPQSVNSIIAFGSLPAAVGGKKRGAPNWRVDISLPAGASLERAEVPFLNPPVLHLKDGRCFQIDLNPDWNAPSHLRSAGTTQIECRAPRKLDDPDLRPIDRPGMRYVGRAWDLDAYRDEKSGRTLLFQDVEKDSVPLMSTSMHVLALGAMGSPDSGGTEVRLLGLVGNRLVLADVYLNVAYA